MSDEDVKAQAARFDHLDPSVAAGIHQFYDSLRKVCPIAHSDAHGGFHIVTRHRDIVEVGKNPDRFSAAVEGLGAVMLVPEFATCWATLFEQDPPAHTGWRRFMQQWFSEEAVAGYEPYVQRVARQMVARIEPKGSADLVSELSVLIPPMVVGELLGVPEQERVEFSSLARGFFAAAGSSSEDATKAVSDYAAYLRKLVHQRRGAEGKDLLTSVANATIDDAAPTDAELLKFAYLMVAAGHLTTADTIANTLSLIASDASLQKRLRLDRSLIPAFIEESVRHESAVAATGRTVRKDTELGGVSLKEGEKVLIAWGSGSRDEDHFDSPEEVRLERQLPRRHIGWGAGSHQCMGIHLARMELRVVLEAVLDLLPNLRLTSDTPIQRTYGVIRGVRELPAAWSSAQQEEMEKSVLDNGEKVDHHDVSITGVQPRLASSGHLHTFRELQEQIAKHRDQLLAHPFIPRLEEQHGLVDVMGAARGLSFFAMAFQDVLRLSAECASDVALAPHIRTHYVEDAGHEQWFLTDIERLGVSVSVAEVFSPAHQACRDLCYELIADALRAPHDACRVVQILSLEATGHVFFDRIVAAIETLGLGDEMKYFGRFHEDVEHQHAVFETDGEDGINGLTLSAEQFALATSALVHTWKQMHRLADVLLAHIMAAQQAAVKVV